MNGFAGGDLVLNGIQKPYERLMAVSLEAAADDLTHHKTSKATNRVVSAMAADGPELLAQHLKGLTRCLGYHRTRHAFLYAAAIMLLVKRIARHS